MGSVFLDFCMCARTARSGAIQSIAPEQTAPQWAPRNDADAVCLCTRQHFQFWLTTQQVVFMLFRDESEEVALFCGSLRDSQMPSGKVTRTYITNFALVNGNFEGTPEFVPGDTQIDVVHLIQLDMIGLQAPQGALEVSTNFVCRKAASLIRSIEWIFHNVVNLGRKHDPFAAPTSLCEPTADNFLCPATVTFATVHVRSIEKVNPSVECCVHNAKCVFFIGFGSEVHCAKAQSANHQPSSAKLGKFHTRHLFRIVISCLSIARSGNAFKYESARKLESTKFPQK
ncbi:aminotransferase class I and II [Alicyclobacillus hesperidum URH17-3-68]|nr:aminotransferase class I and II [Alicyclobacillus hesperidum URH17-3-68]